MGSNFSPFFLLFFFFLFNGVNTFHSSIGRRIRKTKTKKKPQKKIEVKFVQCGDDGAVEKMNQGSPPPTTHSSTVGAPFFFSKFLPYYYLVVDVPCIVFIIIQKFNI